MDRLKEKQIIIRVNGEKNGKEQMDRIFNLLEYMKRNILEMRNYVNRGGGGRGHGSFK